MAAVIKCLCLVFLCSLIVGGKCQPCSEINLKIRESATGKFVENKPEWNVTITTDCPCSQLSIKLSCDGFQTTEGIDSSVLSKSGTECLLKDGGPIHAQETFSFLYAWQPSFPFKPLYSQVECS